MPMLPIDLQTMFSHINQVGKEQAHIKENLPHTQMVQGMELAEQAAIKDTIVDESQEIGEGADKVNQEGQKKQEQRNRKNKDNKRQQLEEKNKKEVYHDPDLGQHIDITT
ncbi:MAG: hypothetical protein JXR70_00500 [Spirochaetales bacterium]|nr:hypothetical protein [Spirochaetales bacterium]